MGTFNGHEEASVKAFISAQSRLLVFQHCDLCAIQLWLVYTSSENNCDEIGTEYCKEIFQNYAPALRICTILWIMRG